MIYSDFCGKRLSALGMGCMRLPVINGDASAIDMQKTKQMVELAVKSGVNYFDTAWGYHNGQSEPVMGEVLSAYPRESYYLASKFPGYDLSNMDKVQEIFEAQLKRCCTDYFDFYLFHNVCEMNIDGYLNEKYGIFEYLIEQKKNGRIRHLGFSTHGSLATMRRFLDAYGKHMEFGQLQINWLDWEFQNAKAKVEMLSEYGIPVWVMEPVRGGSLATLESEYEQRLNALRPGVTAAEWAFRFVQSVPEVRVTLSGMSNETQLTENIATFSTEKPLSEAEKQVLAEIARERTAKNKVPCTACRYCTAHCPRELDIPWLIELYNEHTFSGGGFIAPMAMEALGEGKKPFDCIGCRSCEAVCPQGIRVADIMADFGKRLGDDGE